MNNPFKVLAITVACSIVTPVVFSLISYRGVTIGQDEEIKKPIKIEEVINYEKIDKDSPIINIYNHKKGINEKINIEEYLYGVLSGEMPVEFNIEALKAQAVAARTYVLYKQENEKSSKHPNAVVCTDYTHCQEYKSYDELEKIKGKEWMQDSYNKIKQAVDETKGHIIIYEDKPILPLYFSTSSGKTENSEEVFANEVPYLKSVDSPYDKESPKYESTLQISKDEFIKNMKRSYNDITLSASNLKEEIKVIEISKGGSVEKIKIGNKELKGRDIRSIFNLNSSNFEIEVKGEDVDFLVKGYGHGVGMSQWGAQGMSDEGYKYYDILNHYYYL